MHKRERKVAHVKKLTNIFSSKSVLINTLEFTRGIVDRVGCDNQTGQMNLKLKRGDQNKLVQELRAPPSWLYDRQGKYKYCARHH